MRATKSSSAIPDSTLVSPLAARGESTIGRAHGACGIWVREAAHREFKARGGGDVEAHR